MNDPLGRCRALADRAAALGAVPTAVVYPCSRDALAGASEAAALGLITPVLIGPADRITALCREAQLDSASCSIIDIDGPAAAAREAAAMVERGEVRCLMKGSLHTDELMSVALSRDAGLRTARRVSHVFVMDVPTHDRLLLISDCAVNIAPDLPAKREIVQNAIALAHALGIAMPHVALLSAVETVNPAIPSTLDAAALCKMADRGQITGAVLDGPLAFDNAISAQAAHTKGIDSPVSGRADILIVPALEAGNMLYKQLVYLSGALAAGVVLGAKVPIILTSRADSPESRTASTAVACLWAHHLQETA
ncbi:MAG TPA: bifunctional enoyl-CoA hydratase/phosphate acetyltransferase [Burkholderiales bacterium]|nr:bifunctional enoyl-CoA hydratase/phosphate acetyltransferase [Burkholderiales bacterium]